MGMNISYPDGSTLTSTALTVAQINLILQQLSLGMMGQTVNPTNDFVRIAWPTEGAPFSDVSEDICYLSCVPRDHSYDKIRDRSNESASDPNLEEIWTYTRVWEIRWVLYGPNSTDYARALRSALYQDYFTEALQNSQLFPESDFPQPIRVPEQINGQWYERVDFKCLMYEFIQETILRQTVESVEVIVKNSDGTIADVTVTA